MTTTGTLEFDRTDTLNSRGTGRGETNGAESAVATLRAEYELLAAAYRETTRRYEMLRSAAQAAVIESRTSHRNPITPITEALAELDETPAPGIRLRDLPLATTSAWPRGNEAGS
jgi:hypothetical protein